MEKTTFCVITLLISSVFFWIIRNIIKRLGIKKLDSESSNIRKIHKDGFFRHMYWLLKIIYLVLFESMILIISLEQLPIPTLQTFQQYKEHLKIDEVKETDYTTIMLLNKLVDHSGKTSYKYAVCMKRSQCDTDDDIYTFYSDHILNSENAEYEMETRQIIIKFPYRIRYSIISNTIDVEKKTEKELLYKWKIPGLDTGNSLSEKEKEKQLEKVLTTNYTFYQEAVEDSRITAKFKITFIMGLAGIFLVINIKVNDVKEKINERI